MVGAGADAQGPPHGAGGKTWRTGGPIEDRSAANDTAVRLGQTSRVKATANARDSDMATPNNPTCGDGLARGGDKSFGRL